jgi:hypothetical protein
MAVPIEVALVNYIRSNEVLMALVGGRVYPVLAPTQAALPYIVYGQTAYRSERHMLGVSVLKWSTIDWDAYGTPHDEASAIRDGLIAIFDGFRGGLSAVGISQIFIRGIGDTLVEDKSGSQQMIYACSVQVEIAYYDPELVDP